MKQANPYAKPIVSGEIDVNRLHIQENPCTGIVKPSSWLRKLQRGRVRAIMAVKSLRQSNTKENYVSQ